MMKPTFAMLSCACGAEQVVKTEMADEGWRLAFSRPGFVTAKNDQDVPLPNGVFVRTASRSLGQVRGSQANAMVAELASQLAENDPNGQKFDQLHVWPKDRVPIGRFGFEPGADEVSSVVSDAVYSGLNETWLKCDAPNRIAQPGDRVLDLVLVDPSHWFMGVHEATVWPTRWPGAVQPIQPLNEPVSRAYYKAAESITWSGFDMQPGDLAVEIGSAPGGACGRLLELGLRVIGVDPAEMDPRINQHPNFQHIRARGGDLPRRQFRGAKWLLVDSNVRPDQTLTTIENIVTHRQSDFVGLLITLKIGDYSSASLIDTWFDRIVRWKPSHVQVRQLARNKCEVCFAVSMV
ncbi:MAG: SAM-dependent methyltransferase [Rubripirellula sp.]